MISWAAHRGANRQSGSSRLEGAPTRENEPVPRVGGRSEHEDFGWVITYGCKNAGEIRRLKVNSDPASDASPIEVPCPCGEVHRVTVSPYRRRRSADLEVDSLAELRD